MFQRVDCEINIDFENLWQEQTLAMHLDFFILTHIVYLEQWKNKKTKQLLHKKHNYN